MLAEWVEIRSCLPEAEGRRGEKKCGKVKGHTIVEIGARAFPFVSISTHDIGAKRRALAGSEKARGEGTFANT